MGNNTDIYKVVVATDKNTTVYKLVTSTLTSGAALSSIKVLCGNYTKPLIVYRNGEYLEKLYPAGYVKTEIRILDMDTGKVHKSIQSVAEVCGLAPATIRHRLYLKVRSRKEVAYREGGRGLKRKWHNDTELAKFKDRFCIFRVYFVYENGKNRC